MTETLAQMGTYMRVLSESFLMITKMTGFGWFSKICVLWTKVASISEGLKLIGADTISHICFIILLYFRDISICAIPYIHAPEADVVRYTIGCKQYEI